MRSRIDNKLEALYELKRTYNSRHADLCNTRFEQQSIEYIQMGPGTPPDSVVRLKDCSFVKCEVQGAFLIYSGCELDTVTFDNVKHADMITMSCHSIFKHVTFKGVMKSGGLWIKPLDTSNPNRLRLCEEWTAKAWETIDWMLDISDFDAKEIEIVGIPATKVRINPERQIVVRREWGDSEAWKELKLPVLSFWGQRLLRVRKVFNVPDGVYSLPRPKDKIFEQAMHELKLLTDAGIVIRP